MHKHVFIIILVSLVTLTFENQITGIRFHSAMKETSQGGTNVEPLIQDPHINPQLLPFTKDLWMHS